MPHPFAKQAVVIGAGLGGIAAAKALAPHFEKVTVLDRDVLPEGPAPRTGTPQARHGHALLAGGQRRSSSFFQAFPPTLKEPEQLRRGSGSTSCSNGRDLIRFRSAISASTRSACHSFFESLCRRRLMEEPNFDVRPRTRLWRSFRG